MADQVCQHVNRESTRDHDRLGAAVAACGKQFERSPAVGLGAATGRIEAPTPAKSVDCCYGCCSGGPSWPSLEAKRTTFSCLICSDLNALSVSAPS
jgi:hypothetical protein